MGASLLESLRRLQSLANKDAAMRLLDMDRLMRHGGVPTQSDDLESLGECLSVVKCRFKGKTSKVFQRTFHVWVQANKIDGKVFRGIQVIQGIGLVAPI